MPLHRDISYNSPEFNALRQNNLDYIKNNFKLYENLKDYWLTAASCYSNVDINTYFIEQGANSNFYGTENFTNAISQNNIALVQLYVSHNCILLESDDVHLGGAVMCAINNDNVDMLKYLISIGCNIHLDNDYAFNRGIAENAKSCVKYLAENHSMRYDPSVSYNIQKIISDNSYETFQYVINLIAKPFNFNFSNQINFLFSSGHPEIFDLFVDMEFINEETFVEHFYSIFYNFPEQQKLYEHIKSNYSNWFEKAQNHNVETSKTQRMLDFMLSQKHNKIDNYLTIDLIKEIQKCSFICNFLKNQPYYLSQVLLENIEQKNNRELLEYTYQSSFIHEKNIQKTLDDILPNIVDSYYFSDFMKLLFKETFTTEFSNLNKIYHYFRLDNSMITKNKQKFKKI